MAPPPTHHQAEERLQGGLPHRRIRLHHHPNLPKWPNWLHGLLQGRQPRCQEPTSIMVCWGGGYHQQILQQGDPQGFVCATYLCTKGFGLERKLWRVEGLNTGTPFEDRKYDWRVTKLLHLHFNERMKDKSTFTSYLIDSFDLLKWHKLNRIAFLFRLPAIISSLAAWLWFTLTIRVLIPWTEVTLAYEMQAFRRLFSRRTFGGKQREWKSHQSVLSIITRRDPKVTMPSILILLIYSNIFNPSHPPLLKRYSPKHLSYHHLVLYPQDKSHVCLISHSRI